MFGKTYVYKCIELVSSATTGPWEVTDVPDGKGLAVVGVGMEIAMVQETLPDTAQFIAEARSMVPELARLLLIAHTRVEELETELTELKSLHSSCT